MAAKKRSIQKAAKKKSPNALAAVTKVLRLELQNKIQEVDRWHQHIVACLSESQRLAVSCSSLAKTALEFEGARQTKQLRTLSLLSVKSSDLTESKLVELAAGGSQRLDFVLQVDGPFEILLSTMGYEICFMTEAVYLGRCFCKGSFLRAEGEGKSGQVLFVTVSRN
jgi:hypothetical protein